MFCLISPFVAVRWRHLDSSALNERPDEPVSKEKGFTPQYGVTGQGMHFHESEEGTHAAS